MFRFLALGAALVVAGAAGAQTIRTEEHALRAVTVVGGLVHPWSVAFLPDGRMLVTERPGRLRLVGRDGRLEPRPLDGLPANIAALGQGGLLDVALHPKFAENGWVYLSYAGRDATGVGTEVARARLAGDRLTELQTIFRMQPKSAGGRHFGSRLVFDRDGYLFVTLGERGEQERAQRLDDDAGKIVRLHDDGRVPADNPFAQRAGARPEVFSLGNRNVQGAALHPRTGALWAHEHGPQGGDELNVIRAGVNYGWPVITYGKDYDGRRIGEGTEKAGMEQPVYYWDPVIAPSGMVVYAGDAFSSWKGNILVGGLASRVLVRLVLEDGVVAREERYLGEVKERIRDVQEGRDGLIYVVTDEDDGKLLRISPNATSPR